MRGSPTLEITPSRRMGPAMTLFEPAGKAPDPSALAGFVPCQSEDAVARQLLRPLFDDERETLLLAGFDAFERLARFERVDGDGTGRCVIPSHCWRGLLSGRIAAVVIAHNHPSSVARPSDADIRTTHEAAYFLRTMGIELVDHLIFVASGHFSFRTAQML